MECMNDLNVAFLRLFSSSRKYTYARSKVILTPNEPVTGGYYLASGYVRQYGLSPTGAELTIHIFTPGSLFPLMWIVNDIPNRYYFEALEKTTIYLAPKEDIVHFFQSNEKLWGPVVKRLLDGLDKVSSRLELLAYEKAPLRIISTLIYLARHFGKQTRKGIMITLRFSHRDIATFAGMSRETVSRELEKLNKKGLISSYKRFLLVPNIEKLKQIMQG